MHRSLDPLLRAQHGIVSRARCRAVELTDRQVNRMLAGGLLVPVFSSIYRDPASASTVEQKAMAAVLAGGPGALASHRMALAIHRMRNFRCDMYEISAPRRVECANLRAHRISTGLERRVVRGVPVTTPARTLLDSATVLGQTILARFIETWLSTGVIKLSQIETELAHSNGHHGVGAVLRALDSRMLMKEEPDSPPESALGQLLVRHRLPVPDLHHLVTLPSGAVFELDWSYPEAMVAFEMDGYGVHLRSLDAFEHDRFRRNELVVAGWSILNFTKRMLTRTPLTIIDQVRRLVDGRALPRE